VTLLAGLDVARPPSRGLLVAPDGEVVARAEAGHALATPRPAGPGDPLERRAHGGGVRRDRVGGGLESLIALTGNRALPGFTAPKLRLTRAP
jgi:hypothetical protein